MKEKVKKILIFLLLVGMLISQIIISISADTGDNMLSYDEAWELVRKSYELYVSLHLPENREYEWPKGLNNKLGYNVPSGVTVTGRLNTVEEISDYSETIFVPEIAHYIWSCYQQKVWIFDNEKNKWERKQIYLTIR